MATTDEGRLVEAARAGDPHAFGQLFDHWFDRVHDLSRRIVHDTGIAGEVAQDAFLTAWTKLATLEDPDAFGGWLLRIARNASLNRLAKEQRAVPVDDETMTLVTDASAPDHDPLERMDQAGRIALVWDAAAALGERDLSVLDLHLRHGLTPAELADELGVTPNNAHQVLFTMRKRLGNAVRALVLWRAGHPTCADLRQGLTAAGLTSFGAPMVKVIDRHVDGCATCSDDRTERLSPAALFAAAPVVAAPVLLKANAAHALEASGVPMSGSTAGTASGAGSGGAGSGGAGGTPAPGGPAVAGSGAGAGGGPPDAPVPAAAGGGRPSLQRRLLMAAAAVAVVGLLLGILLAERAGNDQDLRATGPTTTEPTRVDEADPAKPVTSTAEPGDEPTTTVEEASTTTTTTTAPTTTTTAPEPPIIDDFTATPSSTVCDNWVIWNVSWATTRADSAVVGVTTSKGTEVAPDGSTTVCAPQRSLFFLNALGPGGTTSATAGGGSSTPTTTTTIIP